MGWVGETPSRCDPRVARTRATVLARAEVLLVAEGLDAVTFDRVARDTGVSRTTLYRHWARPLDLLMDAYEQVTRPAAVPATDDLEADLLRIFTQARDGLERGAWRRITPSLVAAAAENDDLGPLHARFIRDRRRPVLDRLELARTRGELPAAADLDLAVDLIVAPLFYRRLLRHVDTPDDVLRRVLRVALADLGWTGARTGPAR